MSFNINLDSSFYIIFLAVWELVWKGIALYRAARDDDRVWFVSLLFINSAGLLPIAYLLIRQWRKKEFKIRAI